MIQIIIAIAITGIFSLITAYYYTTEKYSMRVFFKTLSSAGFVLVAIFSLRYNLIINIVYACGILAALLLGLLGDILLSMHPLLNKKDGDIFNLAGMAAFLLGHFSYTGVFLYLTVFNYFSILYILILPLIVIILMQLKILDGDKIKVPVVLYSFVISIMFVQGIYVFASSDLPTAVFILIGALLFILSDSALTFYNFSRFKWKYLMPVCLIMYYAAQILFAFSISL